MSVGISGTETQLGDDEKRDVCRLRTPRDQGLRVLALARREWKGLPDTAAEAEAEMEFWAWSEWPTRFARKFRMPSPAADVPESR